MLYQGLAKIVVVIHFAFIVYVIFGPLLGLIWPKTLWLHAAALLWSVLIMMEGFVCPLTPLENYLRELGEGSVYEGAFITQYFLRIIYPPGLTRSLQITLALMLLLWTTLLYLFLWRKGKIPLFLRDVEDESQ